MTAFVEEKKVEKKEDFSNHAARRAQKLKLRQIEKFFKRGYSLEKVAKASGAPLEVVKQLKRHYDVYTIQRQN